MDYNIKMQLWLANSAIWKASGLSSTNQVVEWDYSALFHNDDVTSKFKPKNVDMTFIKEFVGKRALSNEDQVS